MSQLRDGMRSISLFALSGEDTLMDDLQARMRLREYGIVERYTKEEFRGAFIHLREIFPSEVQRVTRRFADLSEFSKLKCLLLRIQSQKDLRKEIVRSAVNILQQMGAGEVKVLPI